MFAHVIHPRSIKRAAVAVGLAALIGLAACSDDKPDAAESGKSSGGESTLSRANRRANEVHSDFKEEIQPAAGWVDDRSHEVADEARSAAGKGVKAIEGDDDPPVEPTTTPPAAPKKPPKPE